MEYSGYVIYVLNFGYVFQYLFADSKRNIYQDYVLLTPQFKNKIKHMLGMIASPFSQDDIDYGEQVVLSGAMKSIDALIEKEKTVAKDESILSPIQMA